MNNALNNDNKTHVTTADKQSTPPATQAICDDHLTAAQHHDHASKNHKDAVKCHEAGDHKAASVCNDKAHEHTLKAVEAGKQSTSKIAAVQATKTTKA